MATEQLPHHKLKAIVEQREAGEVDNAIALLQILLQDHPKFVKGWLELGKCWQMKRDRTQAVNCFCNVLELLPSHLTGRIQLAKEYADWGDPETAKQHLQVALAHHPHHFLPLLSLGELALSQEDWAAALQWFDQTIAAHPQRPEPYLKKNTVLLALKQLDAAENNLKTLLNHHPQHLPGQIQYGIVLQKQGQFLAALEIFEVVLAVKPSLDHVINRLCTCALKLGDTLEDTDVLTRVVRQIEAICQSHHTSQRLTQLRLLLGSRYQKQQKLQQAKEHYQQILLADSNHLAANLKLATVCRQLGDLDAAESRLKIALAHSPQHSEPLQQLGQLEYTRQRFDAALAYFHQAHTAAPDLFGPHLHILKILRDLGRFDEALRYLDSIKSEYANDPRLLMQQGLLSRHQGHRGQALAQFRASHELALNFTTNKVLSDEALWLVIEELRDMGQWDIAKQVIDESAEEFRRHIRTQMLLGSILQRQQNLATATKLYRQILQDHCYPPTCRLELARCLSQTGQVSDAITLLQETHHQLPPHPGVFLLLGQLHQALQNVEQAQHWYALGRETFPYHPGLQVGWAECLCHQGQYHQAMADLSQAQKTLPRAVAIPLKRAQLAQRFGEVDESYAILQQAHQRFPANVAVQLELSQLHIRCGEYGEAIAILDSITTEHYSHRKRIQNQRGDIALQQFHLAQAEQHYRAAFALQPSTQQERMQLARIFILAGQLDAAYEQLHQATQELEVKHSPGQVGIPVKNHIAAIVNEFRINPMRLGQLQAAQSEEGGDRLLALAGIAVQEPSYFGTMIFIAKELSMQGIWGNLRTALTTYPSHRSPMPKTIIQFWNEPEPPGDVEKLGRSWVEHNPDYSYKRFSLEEAIAFLTKHYDPEILKAFQLCGHAATQADFFRLAYLNCRGGFYADVDDRCRQSLEPLRQSRAELILYQEDFACFGNNFIGCVPHHPMIRSALYQAVDNLLNYSAEWAWSQTGPGLLTTAVCTGLLPYLAHPDYRMWPRMLVLSQGELSAFVWPHIPLSYKKTEKAWQFHAYPKVTMTNSN